MYHPHSSSEGPTYQCQIDLEMGSDAVARTEALHPYLYTEMAQTLGNIFRRLTSPIKASVLTLHALHA